MEARASRPGPAAMISKWRTVLTRQTPDPAGGSDPARELPGWSSAWVPDRWLDGFETLTYAMVGCPHLPEEGSGHLVSTLVRYGAPRRRRAVLYLHGWNEYFFQRHEAEFFEQLGYDFYAVDLHRYGRSLQAGELPGYMESVEDYYEEIDAALALIKRDHDRVILYGHSTGGLIASLYASDRPKQFVGVLLNSPWIDMQGSALFRALTPPLVRGLAVASPTMTLPASENDLYGRSLHQDFEGEWDFDLTLKRIESQPLRPGWVKAVVDGHDRVGAGLRIDAPVLVVTSARSSAPKEWCEDAMSTDLALDVERIAARVHLLGWHVTLVRLQGALHDVSLSRPAVRTRFFDEIRRWDLAYVRGRRAQATALRDAGE